MNLKQVLCFALIGVAFATAAQLAQACEGFAAMTKGTRYQLTTYDKGDKNKIVTTSDYEVKSSRNNGATTHIRTTDEKGKTTVNADYDINCTGSGVAIDTKTLLSKEMSANITSPDVKADVTGNNLEIPSKLSVGQSLPESKINIVISAGKIKLTSDVNVHNRKVIGQEKVTVPAGSFDCYVISDETITKMLVSKTSNNKIWIAKEVGTVKQDSYDKNGKLDKLKLLTKFQK